MEKGSRGPRTDEFTYIRILHRFIERHGNLLERTLDARERTTRSYGLVHAYADLRRFEDRLVTADRPTDQTGAKAVGESRMPVIDIN